MVEKCLRCFGKFGRVENAQFDVRKLASLVFEGEKIVEMLFQILEGNESAGHVAFDNANIPRFVVEAERARVEGFENGFLDTCRSRWRESYLQSLYAVFVGV